MEVRLAAPIVEALGFLAVEASRTVAAVGVVAAETAVVAIAGCWCCVLFKTGLSAVVLLQHQHPLQPLQQQPGIYTLSTRVKISYKYGAPPTRAHRQKFPNRPRSSSCSF